MLYGILTGYEVNIHCHKLGITTKIDEAERLYNLGV